MLFDEAQYNFKVKKVPIHLGSGIIIPKEQGMHIVDDNGVPLAATTSTYNLVPVQEIINPISNKIEEMFGKDIETTTKVVNKTYFQFEAKFTKHTYEIDGLGEVTPQFRFKTSYNRSYRNNGMVGDFRSFCYNTLISGDKYAHVYNKHTKNFSVTAFTQKVSRALELMSGNKDKYKHWYNTSISRDDAVDLFRNTICSYQTKATKETKTNDKMLGVLMENFDHESNHLHGNGAYSKGWANKGSLWTAYNAATYWSTHLADTARKSKNPFTNVERREQQVIKLLNSLEWKSLEKV
jgi:hypothetical protein